ncbi:hypothetical protein BLNAU_1519 [Blattamonas nauphoetae]|uniref:Uncharacterized protein n=1 Tax=Blattamonas nauphoetae TaxID=2049346 RepID=A0ABQ9YI91_9EUKA|nr:hypothetical protein BLNAU_1519 [Blattamonas nauphoetae]
MSKITHPKSSPETTRSDMPGAFVIFDRQDSPRTNSALPILFAPKSSQHSGRTSSQLQIINQSSPINDEESSSQQSSPRKPRPPQITKPREIVFSKPEPTRSTEDKLLETTTTLSPAIFNRTKRRRENRSDFKQSETARTVSSQPDETVTRSIEPETDQPDSTTHATPISSPLAHTLSTNNAESPSKVSNSELLFDFEKGSLTTRDIDRILEMTKPVSKRTNRSQNVPKLDLLNPGSPLKKRQNNLDDSTAFANSETKKSPPKQAPFLSKSPRFSERQKTDREPEFLPINPNVDILSGFDSRHKGIEWNKTSGRNRKVLTRQMTSEMYHFEGSSYDLPSQPLTKRNYMMDKMRGRDDDTPRSQSTLAQYEPRYETLSTQRRIKSPILAHTQAPKASTRFFNAATGLLNQTFSEIDYEADVADRPFRPNRDRTVAMQNQLARPPPGRIDNSKYYDYDIGKIQKRDSSMIDFSRTMPRKDPKPPISAELDYTPSTFPAEWTARGTNRKRSSGESTARTASSLSFTETQNIHTTILPPAILPHIPTPSFSRMTTVEQIDTEKFKDPPSDKFSSYHHKTRVTHVPQMNKTLSRNASVVSKTTQPTFVDKVYDNSDPSFARPTPPAYSFTSRPSQRAKSETADIPYYDYSMDSVKPRQPTVKMIPT